MITEFLEVSRIYIAFVFRSANLQALGLVGKIRVTNNSSNAVSLCHMVFVDIRTRVENILKGIFHGSICKLAYLHYFKK